MFSTPDEGGSLKSQGGWMLFIMDMRGLDVRQLVAHHRGYCVLGLESRVSQTLDG